jgi:predicted aldo/keto reductase-like oxidoreductase
MKMPPTPVPLYTVREYKNAFLSFEHKMKDSKLMMLTAHFHAPNRRITAQELSEILDHNKFNAVNIHYGQIGNWLSQALRFVPTGNKLSIFVDVIEPFTDGNSEKLWEMREPVADALRDLDWV